MANIPIQVKKAAAELIEAYGDSIVYIGEYSGCEAYLFQFPKDSSTGFPFVYLLGDNQVTEVSGNIALDIINLLIKDDGE